MAKPYEIHGIPDNTSLEFDEPPDYAVIYERKDKDTFDRAYGLMPGDIRLWGQAEYWTVLEAALLLVGISPDDYELYAVEKGAAADEDFVDNGEFYYSWKYEYKFDSAKDYLFLFERSTLAPKAPPIEWVKYFNQKVRDVSVRPPFEPNYCDDWLEFFGAELNRINQVENKPLEERGEIDWEANKTIELFGPFGKEIKFFFKRDTWDKHDACLILVGVLPIEFEPFGHPKLNGGIIKVSDGERDRLDERRSMYLSLWESNPANPETASPETFIKWALSKEIEIPWLSFAIGHGLLPASVAEDKLKQNYDKSALEHYLLYDLWNVKNALSVLCGLDYTFYSGTPNPEMLEFNLNKERDKEAVRTLCSKEYRLKDLWERSENGFDYSDTPAYFIEWALSKRFRPDWLDWAIVRGLYTPKQETVTDKPLQSLPNYSTKWLEIQQAAIAQFFNPRRNPDAKKDEVIEWINTQAVSAGLGESNNIASTIFTIIKPENHDPKKKRCEPQQAQ